MLLQYSFTWISPFTQKKETYSMQGIMWLEWNETLEVEKSLAPFEVCSGNTELSPVRHKLSASWNRLSLSSLCMLIRIFAGEASCSFCSTIFKMGGDQFCYCVLNHWFISDVVSVWEIMLVIVAAKFIRCYLPDRNWMHPHYSSSDPSFAEGMFYLPMPLFILIIINKALLYNLTYGSAIQDSTKCLENSISRLHHRWSLLQFWEE